MSGSPRRAWLGTLAGLACSLAVAPARATRDAMQAQIAASTRGVAPHPGKIELSLPEYRRERQFGFGHGAGRQPDDRSGARAGAASRSSPKRTRIRMCWR